MTQPSSSDAKEANYQSTLNLPETNFSMKADLVKKEPLIRQQWETQDLYHQILNKLKGKPKYILHDGPPYANGDVHVGTALNKILKDIIVKFKSMRGYYSPYIPGWDCHGLPIEHRVTTAMGAKAKTVSKHEIRVECEKYARKYIDIQRKQFQALGVLGDWSNPYLTLNPSYEAAVLDVFSDLVKNGYVYRRLKPIHWCIHCETVLAEAELEYADATSPSIYLKFPIAQTEELTKRAGITLPKNTKSVSFLIWTTTPWTLPANVAVALNETFEYAFVEANNEVLIFADGLVENVMDVLEIKNHKIIGKVKGGKLEHLTYIHPFLKRTCQVILADYVRLEDGTGIVHTAPGHGEEDYVNGLKYNLPVLSPVDKSGRFTAEAGILPGENVFAADDKICRMLTEQGFLMKRVDVTHSYPHCWRCKKPVIFRATVQWFISVDNKNARQRALDEIKKVKWIPQWGELRTATMLEQRPDWCISRQRNWGIPIPAFYCVKCNEPLLDGAVIDFVKDIFRKEGANSWFIKPVADLMPPGTKCPKCASTEFAKEHDIFDVWFESGSSFRAVVIENKDLQFPSDLYLEGSDQPSRWFQLSLIPSVMTRAKAPFKNVLIHGFVKRPEGEKLSKSKGGLMADEIVAKLGADIIRLWIASINFTDDLPVSMEILAEKGDPYRKIRNTFRYLLGNLYDFNPDADSVKYDQLYEIDKWALNELHRLNKTVTKAYDDFEFYKVFREVYEFCVVEMSSFYFDILKDRLYTYGKKSVDRRAAQTVLNEILLTLTKIIAPILSFTAEEIWTNIRSLNPTSPQAVPLIGKSAIRNPQLESSVHLTDWPPVDESRINDELEANWKKLFRIRAEVTREIEQLRKNGKIGSSVEAQVKLYSDDAELLKFLKSYEKDFPMILKVSLAEVIEKPVEVVSPEGLKLAVEISKSPYPKCQRCWSFIESVGKNPTHPNLCERCVGVITNKS